MTHSSQHRVSVNRRVKTFKVKSDFILRQGFWNVYSRGERTSYNTSLDFVHLMLLRNEAVYALVNQAKIADKLIVYSELT